MLILTGCSKPQSMIRWHTTDPNGIISQEIPWPAQLTGSAADKIADVLAANVRDKQGRLNEMLKYNPLIYLALVGCLLGGFVFWGITKSKSGWIIPATAIGGIIFIRFWSSDWAGWVAAGVSAITISLLLYKAIEWQKERNEESLKPRRIE